MGSIRRYGYVVFVATLMNANASFATSPHIIEGSGVIHDYNGECASLASAQFTGCSVAIGLATTDSDTDTSRGDILAEVKTGGEGDVCFLSSQSNARVSLQSSGVVNALDYGFGKEDLSCVVLPDRYVSIRDGSGGYWAVYLSDNRTSNFKFGEIDDSVHPWMACNASDQFSRSTGCTPVDGNVIVGGDNIQSIPVLGFWALLGLSGFLGLLAVKKSRKQ